MLTTHQDEGLRKLIFSSDLPADLQAGMHLLEDPAKLTKTAAINFRCDSEELKPDKNHVGIHTIALGETETYGHNRNGDGWPKKACASRHGTFVTHGAVFIGHDNRDRAKAVGKIVKSAYNESMGRIELFIHVDKNKAAPQLHKLATTGEHSFSMAAKVPFDRCSLCGTLRKSAADPRQCEHVRDHLSEIWADGRAVFTHNDLPTWFDESFVDRPADRIAWNLKVAGTFKPIDSVKMAEASGIWVPDDMEADVPGYNTKHALLLKLAALDQKYQALAAKQAHGGYERYMWELRKAAGYVLPADVIAQLRTYQPDDVFAKLARCGVVLDAASFYKYALGDDYGELATEMDAILRDVRAGLFDRLNKTGGYQRVCRNTYFDVDSATDTSYGVGQNAELSAFAVEKIATAGAFTGQSVDSRIIEETVCGRQPELHVVKLEKSATGDRVIHRGAEIYAAYKLSALDAILGYHKQANQDQLLALAAVQNLVR